MPLSFSARMKSGEVVTQDQGSAGSTSPNKDTVWQWPKSYKDSRQGLGDWFMSVIPTVEAEAGGLP